MTFTHALSTNNYGPCRLIVATSAANGTHTTLASAMAAASVGDTIFLRDSVTENITITPGVNIAAWNGQSANTPAIIGTLTMTGAGTSTISGIRLQTNAAFAIAVTGSAASILNLKNCYLDFTNNTGISYTTSNAASQINFYECNGNLGTTGIGIYSSSSAGSLFFFNLTMNNTGSSSTASTNSAGSVGFSNLAIFSPLSVSSAASLIINGGFINSGNNTCITSSGTSTVSIHLSCSFSGGTASAISIGSGTTCTIFESIEVSSSNTNAITGAGTISYGLITYLNSSSNNVTTQNAKVTQFGIIKSSLQPAFLATHTVLQANQTGNGATATVNFTTEIFDQNSNYDGTNTFTAPFTGRYQFNSCVAIDDAVTSTFGYTQLTTSNRNYLGSIQTPWPLGALTTYEVVNTVLADMDAADTCIVQGTVTGMAGNTADYPAAATQSYFSGFLAC